MNTISKTQYLLHPIGVATGRGGDEGKVASAMIELRGNCHRLVSRVDLTRKVKERFARGMVEDTGTAISQYMRSPGIMVFLETVYDDGSVTLQVEKAQPRKEKRS
jgi:hypothetical protein